MQSRQIRQQFLDFFRSKDHAIVDSSPVVPFDDPTLMFTNAGMNQFKDVFLGTGSRPYRRAADTQKCIRAGGKHNDLDDVGQDTYHHTFFEMLGNWSFGDYFKKEAIEWAWELLTAVWGIDKSRLHATYFEGDAHDGLEPDSEAAALWRTVTDIDPSHIHPGNKKDNFWEMGDTGPCGPCSEIHIDLTPDKSGAGLVNKGDARVMEIWNLVFIQFNRGADGKLSPLPARHVDTGMGFERLCAVLQGMERNKLGKVSNYDTDVFTPIFEAIRKRTGAPPYAGTLPSHEATEPRSHEGEEIGRSDLQSPKSEIDQIMVDVSYRVIADHVRCLTFALTDGAIPSNEGRGYVLRRILRRAVRYGRQYMNMHEPFVCDLVEPLVAHMGDFFPELRVGPVPATPRDNAKYIAEMIRDEEASFLRTLDRGMRLFAEAADHAERHHHGKIRGDDAFKLHDTYGFPIDLTELMAEERGLTIDIGEYERLMEGARERARGAASEGGPDQCSLMEIVKSGTVPYTRFLGYSSLEVASSSFVKIFVARGNGYFPEVANEGDQVAIAVTESPFYAESGGQVGDRGEIVLPEGRVSIRSTIRVGDVHFHIGCVKTGTIHDEDATEVHLYVDGETREFTTKNHTSTHILNWALREVLGSHVQQKGSLVDPEKTRFDFSHPKALTPEEIEKIEQLCNKQVAEDQKVYTDEVEQKAALKINTLRAVFGEKYPDVVRVVSIGAPISEENAKQAGASDWLMKSPTDPKWMQYSVEFCGGTHLKNSREAERIVITEEEAVAKGVRRIVAVSGETAKRAVAYGEELLAICDELDNVARQGAPDLPTRVAALQQKIGELPVPLLVRHTIQQRITDVQKVVKQQAKSAAADAGSAVMDRVEELLGGATETGGVKVVIGEVPAAQADALRGAVDWVRQKTSASAVVLGFADEGKVTLLAGMSKAVVERGIKAGDVIKEIAPLVGGKGGGRPDMAQGGGTDPAGLSKALDRAREFITGKMS
ncbi:MAG: alanine--tRNA ligase [Phycisphaerae bacterium]|nr:alanine--tRNA ligase [Phycisphaerae bacterium]